MFRKILKSLHLPCLLCVFLLQLDKAESQLLSQRNRYRDNGDASLGEDLASQLDDIQHEIPGLVTDGSRAGISRSFDFCQVGWLMSEL